MSSAHRHTLGILSIGVPYFDIATAQRHLEATRRILEPAYGLEGPSKVVTDLDTLDEVLDGFQAARIQALEAEKAALSRQVDDLERRVATLEDGPASVRRSGSLPGWLWPAVSVLLAGVCLAVSPSPGGVLSRLREDKR